MDLTRIVVLRHVYISVVIFPAREANSRFRAADLVCSSTSWSLHSPIADIGCSFGKGISCGIPGSETREGKLCSRCQQCVQYSRHTACQAEQMQTHH